jgi:putative DNA primase/helicase
LIDELDALMAGDKEMAQALRGLINAGFDRAGARLVMNVPTPGGYEPREFSCWAPVALAGIGKLPDTVRDRSIELEMKRKLPSETVRKLRRRDGAELNELARKLVRWTKENLAALKTAAPSMPDGLNDRATDAWEPLVAIADRAGGRWPGLARAASLSLSGEGMRDDNIDTLLLSDIRDVFLAKGGDRITGKELVTALNELEDRPWSEWSRGRPMSQSQMSRRISEYGVVSGNIKTGFGAETAKGYYLRSFEDAFSRYLSPHTPSPPVSNRQSGTVLEEQGETTDFQSGTNHVGAAFKRPENPSNSAAGAGVPLSNGGRTGVDERTLPPDTVII